MEASAPPARGQSIREQTKQGAEAGEDEAHGFQVEAIEGPRQLSLNIGGRKPDESRVTIRQHEVDMGQTEFPMDGSLQPFIVWARVDKTTFEDKHSGDEVIGRKKVASARIDRLRLLPAALAAEVEEQMTG